MAGEETGQFLYRTHVRGGAEVRVDPGRFNMSLVWLFLEPPYEFFCCHNLNTDTVSKNWIFVGPLDLTFSRRAMNRPCSY